MLDGFQITPDHVYGGKTGPDRLVVRRSLIGAMECVAYVERHPGGKFHLALPATQTTAGAFYAWTTRLRGPSHPEDLSFEPEPKPWYQRLFTFKGTRP